MLIVLAAFCHPRSLPSLLVCPTKPHSPFSGFNVAISCSSCLFSKSDSSLLVFGNGNVANEVLSGLASNICAVRETSIKKFFCTFRNERPLGEEITSVEYIPFSEAWRCVSNVTHILITIPPAMSEDMSTYSDPVLDNASIICHLPQNVWIGYISTTGVYGNHDGALVDESSLTLCKPMTKAYAYLDVEKRWQSLQNDSPSRRVFIFRCAGLYGNKMSALHTVLRNGIEDELVNNIVNSQEVITSRVHLEDVSRAIIALMENNSLQGGIYNLADSFPAARNEVMQYAKYLLSESSVIVPGRRQITSTSVNTSERKKRRTSDRKIVSNEKMQVVLSDYGGLLYPSYREGLRQILENNLGNWNQL